jgi:hypothetical protein
MMRVNVVFLDPFGRVPTDEMEDLLTLEIMTATGKGEIEVNLDSGQSWTDPNRLVEFLETAKNIILAVAKYNGKEGCRLIAHQEFFQYLVDKAKLHPPTKTAWEYVTNEWAARED